ncbi:hypothetical protein D3C81_2221990 [compost metagenome]
MQHQLGRFRVFKVQEARNYAGSQHIVVKITFDAFRKLLQLSRPFGIHILKYF